MRTVQASANGSVVLRIPADGQALSIIFKKFILSSSSITGTCIFSASIYKIKNIDIILT